MFKLYFLLSVGLMLIQVSLACDEENQLVRHQQSDEYLASTYEFNPNLGMFHPLAYYESGARVPEFYASPYEGRTPFTKRPTIQSFKKQLNNRPEENNKAEGRFVLGSLGANLINTGLFNNRFTPANTWRPFSN
ncbi:uncharacterized protein LOC124316584 [Daphnia pulicaria]|uniref:uncharacterized protein LOC124316584 n=1 Tax=Daphnia pulicaria TaxID=35523 RepID=UPI001EECE728|nr:uncharacterized protein LOC124316584 [Daphnia pulicaria]